jgi:hypothetical protein
LTNSPLDWSINLLLLLVMVLMPQECVVHGMGFGVHGGGQKMAGEVLANDFHQS